MKRLLIITIASFNIYIYKCFTSFIISYYVEECKCRNFLNFKGKDTGIVDIAIQVPFIDIIKTIKVILSKRTTKLTQIHIIQAHFDHYGIASFLNGP